MGPVYLRLRLALILPEGRHIVIGPAFIIAQFDRGLRCQRFGHGFFAVRPTAIHIGPILAMPVVLCMRMATAITGVAALLIRRLTVPGMAQGAFFQIGGIDPEVMFGMLIVVFRRHPVAGTRGVAGKTEIFFVHLERIPANANARSVAVEKLLTI